MAFQDKEKIESVARRMARDNSAVFGDDFVLAADAYNLASTPDFLTRKVLVSPSNRAYNTFMEAYMKERKKTVRQKLHLNLKGASYENPASAVNECRRQLPGASGERVYRCAISRRGLEDGPRDRNDKLWINAAKHLTAQLNGLGRTTKRRKRR